MKYIKKIVLENFQSHKYTEIELDQHLNVIVGPSDHGKTAIIRGLKWALFNEPSGDFFIREGENECSVTVIFNDGSKIKRYRSKSKNAYYLYNNKGEETVFEGFGTKVPEEIIDVSSMRKIVLDSNQSSSINIGEQLEGPFLLSEKNATRANAIGRLVGVHIIDDALKDTLRDIRNLNIKRKNHEEMLESLQNSLAEYDYLDELIVKTKKLKRIKGHIHNSQMKLNRLVEISEYLSRINEDIILIDEYLNKLENLNRIMDIEKDLTNNFNNYNYIFGRYIRLDRIKKDIEYNNNLLASLINIEKISEIANTANVFLDRVTKLSKANSNLKGVNLSILKNQRLLNELKEIDKVKKSMVIIEEDFLKITKLLNLNSRLDNINKSLSIGKVYIEKLSNIENISDIKDLLELKNKQLGKLVDYKNKYDTIINRKVEVEKGLSQLIKEIESQLDQYKNILIKLEVCPLCFSNIDKFRVEEIINNYR
ncbi:putative RecF/RecN/SMC N-terminal domain protein [[Clostridium] ultunense Esp]|uniref:Nuclease SbcCD subunit C n=1 Tax=[Clostridium] ultunense Esp TaxID=1288971 RepID=M1Z5Q1_9FIRM|nr:AAA family ATPase [Schnuerera ultunensis]CCQ93074.1 putative RecF/RecN/SMC N-terminal domain protein [[Clostridium] ultunense Esp]SHD77079.1 putative RecF/RecN/SMC N-terminal domain protein [[Clostridium] ultunense Esp]